MPLSVRPYHLLCTVCALGEGRRTALAEAVREAPDRPLRIVCNAGDVYAYQDPGLKDDTPEGADYNRKRDLDVLQRMEWPPGVTLPARTAFMMLLERIPTVQGLCGYDAVTSEAWRGCAKADSGDYEAGRALGITALIPPRPEAELQAEKASSLQALQEAEEVSIRPHILLCAVCQYGNGVRPPYPPDNLPELLQLLLHEKPDLPLRMARGADWMMCAPCPARVPELNACVNVLGSGGLSNEKRDLDLLQLLGLQSGSVLPARELFRLIFERVPSTAPVCRREGNRCPSCWWDGCGESNVAAGNSGYAQDRRELMQVWGQSGDSED
jgi:hypothetical protein